MPSTRLLRLALIVSLLLNLVALGIFAGSVIGGRPPPGPEAGLGPLAGAFGPEDRRALLRDLRQRRDIRPPDRALREATLTSLIEALRSDPFDRDLARAAIEQHAARIEEAEAALREAFIERLAAMDPAERQALAERLESARHR